MIRAAAYTRVSTEEQVDGYSLSAQMTAIEKFCELRGYNLVARYSDPGRSGKSAQRPDFQRMIADAKAQQFDVIVVHKLDRFSRSLKDVVIYLSELERPGVGLVSASEAFDYTTPIGKLMLNMLASLAQWYVENLSLEVKKGKMERHRQGHWNGRLSWGYTTPGKLKRTLIALGEQFKRSEIEQSIYSEQCDVIETALEQYDAAHDTAAIPDPDAWQGVVLAFSWYATDKYSDGDVANLLNEAGYRISSRTAGNLFGKETVADILQNRFYLGETSYGNGVAGSSKRRKVAQWIPGAHEPLITRALFEKCQEVRARRAAGHSRDMAHRKFDYPLTGLLFCIDCGGSWSGWTNHGDRFYRRKQVKANCTTEAYSRSADSIENEIGAWLTGLKLPDDWRNRVLALLSDVKEDASSIDELAKLNRQFDRLKTQHRLGDLTDDEYMQQRNAIRMRISEIEAAHQTQPIGEYEQVVKVINDMGRLWFKLEADDRRKVARHLFARIYLMEGVIKAVEPTPVMWVLLRGVGYPVRGEQEFNPARVVILPPKYPPMRLSKDWYHDNPPSVSFLTNY